MNNALYTKLFAEVIKGGMLCPGRVANITHYLLQTFKLNGAMVEFGCNAGRTAALMACVCPEKELWLYDSFQGLPEPGEKDSGKFGGGIMKVSQGSVGLYFEENGLEEPRIIPGWFYELKPNQVPMEIAFAHLDGDLYESTRDALSIVAPRMVKGGVIILDDYGWSTTPGVKAAFVECFSLTWIGHQLKELEISNPNSGQAVILF